MTCGIYKLRFNGTTKCYVGQSLDIERRFKEHTSAMRNTRASKQLQEAYGLYGQPFLEILEQCAKEALDAREDYYIKQYNSCIEGFNVKHTHGHRSTLYGETAPGALASNDDILEIFEYLKDNPEFTAQEIANIVEVPYSVVRNISSGATNKWLIHVYGEEIYNKVIYNKCKRSGELNSAATLSNQDVDMLFHYLLDNSNVPLIKVSELFTNISYETIKSIASGNNHRWLEYKYPEKYAKLLSLKGNRASQAYATADKKYPPVICPDTGERFQVSNIKKFAREHALNDSHLGRLLRGLTKQHKGWTLERV